MNLIDSPHPSFTQFFDDLVTVGKSRAWSELLNWRLEGFSYRNVCRMFQRSGALAAIERIVGILSLTLRALDSHAFPFFGWVEDINLGRMRQIMLFTQVSLEAGNSTYRNNGDFIVNFVLLVTRVDNEQPVQLKVLNGNQHRPCPGRRVHIFDLKPEAPAADHQEQINIGPSMGRPET